MFSIGTLNPEWNDLKDVRLYSCQIPQHSCYCCIRLVSFHIWREIGMLTPRMTEHILGLLHFLEAVKRVVWGHSSIIRLAGSIQVFNVCVVSYWHCITKIYVFSMTSNWGQSCRTVVSSRVKIFDELLVLSSDCALYCNSCQPTS